MSARIILGNCIDKLKEEPAQSIQTCVTSPPYYGLRDYGNADQIGLEETPEQYVDKLVQVFREVKRVLKDDGTLWLNLGDSYAHSLRQSGIEHAGKLAQKSKGQIKQGFKPLQVGYKEKDLIGIPWMVAFALRADGWYLRQDIIWAKPNPMPESVKDRCTKSHEYIFLLSKSQKYLFNPIIEPANYDGRKDEQFKGAAKSYDGVMPNGQPQSFAQNGHARWNKDEEGNRIRNKRSVWTVSTKPYKGAHFATFPPKLIEPCISAGSRKGDTVLDPFNGSGTTGQVALEHGRNYVGFDLNPEYIELTHARLSNVQTSMQGAIA